ncbi:MAG: zinc-binding dehydrogenase [Planctomycetaceae bacterium]|jgi:NADPH:quinone reductase-like Zn-dependent oxidoreductase|nr:zinc-binding dehydrogenase [Planctomycetaceae bacterium]MDP7278043.1 zinc-dependent alcohol dehydrogenase family protein [Planctomycetaceae bacterium]
MKAIRFAEFGEPTDVLTVEEVAVPEPGRGEVLVRMLASPVNPSDLMTIRGTYGKRPSLPFTPGYEGVGVVEQSGGGLLANLRRNRRVVVLNSLTGNWAQRAVVPAQQVVPVPADLPVEQAATFFINPVTAWVMLKKVLAIPAGGWLLQTAAGSQLGRMVIRLGQELGIRTINVVRHDAQVDELTRLGGDAVLAFQADQQPCSELVRMVREITGAEGVRWAIDPVGGPLASAVVECLAPGGRMLCYGTLDDRPLSFSPRSLMTGGARVEGFWLGRWLAGQGLLAKLRTIKTVSGLVGRGVLTSQIGESFGLDQVVEAVAASERPGREGKVLLKISESDG